MIIDFFGMKVHANSEKTEYIDSVPKAINDEIYKRIGSSKPAQFNLNKASFDNLIHYNEVVNPSGLVHSDLFFGSKPIPFLDIKIKYTYLSNYFDSRVVVFDDYKQLIENSLKSLISEYVCIGAIMEDFSNVKGFPIGTSVYFPLIVSPDCKYSGTNLFGYRGKINSNVKKGGYLTEYRDESTNSIMTQWTSIQHAALNPFGFEIVTKNKIKKGTRVNTIYSINPSVALKAKEIAESNSTIRIAGYWRENNGEKKFIDGYWKNVPKSLE